MKKITLLFILFSVISCKPSKVTTIVSEKIRIDTIRDYKVITKFNAVYDTLIIENPCDSIGILKTFYSKITVPQGKIIIRSYRGNIQATVNIDSIENVYQNKYRNKETSNVTNSKKIVTTNIIPAWCILTIIFETFIILGYLYFKIFYV
jgi:hypothetical protein